ncbi:hypothetical protein [Rhodococcus sp. BE178]
MGLSTEGSTTEEAGMAVVVFTALTVVIFLLLTVVLRAVERL